MTSCGSLNYAAPEVIQGEEYDGAAVDMWSCGVILYTMLTGNIPFRSESVPQLSAQIRKGDYHIPPNLSDSVSDLINRLLQPNPVKRATSLEVLSHPWL